VRELTKHAGEALNHSPKYVGDGRLLYLTNMDSEYVGIAQMDLSTGNWKYVVQLDRDVELFDVWRDYLVFALNEGGASGLYYMHIPSGLTHKIALPPGVVTSCSSETAGSSSRSRASTAATRSTHTRQVQSGG